MKAKNSIILIAATAALALPAAASASFTASTPAAGVASLTGDAAADTVTVGVDAGGHLTHGLTGGGFASAADWDTSTDGEQTVDAAAATVTVDGGAGDDSISFVATADVAKAILRGGAGNDVLTGTNKADDLRGDDGNDRLIGVKGDDDMEGGNGNDTLVWNNGDNSDTMDGDAGNDGVEVNGAVTAGDVFTIKPDGPRVRFDRTNLVPFKLDIGSTERMEVNGLGGDDSMSVDNGLGTLLLTLSGGVGADTISGADTHELILGGEDNDTLGGGAGDDRVVGDRGSDTVKGGAGDDTIVWNNGDGSDTMDGEDGLDAVEVNGAVAQADTFTIKPNGDRDRFDRTNLVPFTLDIGSAELLDLNALGGDDSFEATDGTHVAIAADGGAGNDSLKAAASADTLTGGTGDDTLIGGGGLDALDGQSGNDHIEARDGAADLVRCGDGTDTAIADQSGVDALDSCENADRLPDAAAPQAAQAHAKATLKAAKLRKRGSRRSVSFTVSCRAAACKASLSVVTARTVKVAGARVHLVLADKTVALAAGETKTVSLTLPRGARRAAGQSFHARMLFDGSLTKKTLRSR